MVFSYNDTTPPFIHLVHECKAVVVTVQGFIVGFRVTETRFLTYLLSFPDDSNFHGLPEVFYEATCQYLR